MEQFAIGANFEGAAARRNQRKRFNALAEFENFGRQTDGLRRVVSNDAVFDRDFGLHRNKLLSAAKLSVWLERVKGSYCEFVSALCECSLDTSACNASKKKGAAARSTRLRRLHFSNRGNSRGSSALRALTLKIF